MKTDVWQCVSPVRSASLGLTVIGNGGGGGGDPPKNTHAPPHPEPLPSLGPLFWRSDVLVVRGHVSGQVVPLPEGLVADGALELLLASPLDHRLHGKLLLVVRAHVVDEVGGHAEGGVALGAPVLCRQAQRGEGGWQQRQRRRDLQLDGGRALGPEGRGGRRRVQEGALLGQAARHGARAPQLRALQLGGQVVGLIESAGGHGVAYGRVAVQELGRHDEWGELGEGGHGGAGGLAEGTLPLRPTAAHLLGHGGEGAGQVRRRRRWRVHARLRR